MEARKLSTWKGVVSTESRCPGPPAIRRHLESHFASKVRNTGPTRCFLPKRRSRPSTPGAEGSRYESIRSPITRNSRGPQGRCGEPPEGEERNARPNAHQSDALVSDRQETRPGRPSQRAYSTPRRSVDLRYPLEKESRPYESPEVPPPGPIDPAGSAPSNLRHVSTLRGCVLCLSLPQSTRHTWCRYSNIAHQGLRKLSLVPLPIPDFGFRRTNLKRLGRACVRANVPQSPLQSLSSLFRSGFFPMTTRMSSVASSVEASGLKAISPSACLMATTTTP